MARIRSIHPDACKSERLAGVSAEAERCYWRLQTHCDDKGRCEDHSRLIWAALFPLHEDITPARVDGWLDELAGVDLVVRYETEGIRYLAVTQWERFQHPQRPKPSTIPEPSATSTRRVAEVAPIPPRHVLPGEGVGEGDGVGVDIAPIARRGRDFLFEAVAESCGINWRSGLTQKARQSLNAAVRELREVGATPDDVHSRARVHRRKWQVSLTPHSLAKHWPECDPQTQVNGHSRGQGAILDAVARVEAS